MIGYVHDLFGRRLTIFFGFVIAALAIMSQPFLTTIYPGLFIARLVFTCAINGPNGSPLVGDYVKKESRGLASA
jgi:MFS family permease